MKLCHKANIFVLSFVFFLGLILQSQNKPVRYWIMLSDKNNSAYNLNNSSAFLTQAAIERRARQSIPVDSSDLPVNNSYINQIIALNVKVLFVSRWFNAAVIETDSASTQLLSVTSLPFVKNYSRVLGMKRNPDFEKIDYTEDWQSQRVIQNSTYDYGQATAQIEQLNGICLHEKGFDGNNIHIAVLDAGFRKANQLAYFSETFNEGRIKYIKDFSFRNPIYVFSDSTNSHGTAVLSCMAANSQGQMIGTAPKASYSLLRTEYAPDEYIMEEYSWVAGAEFADSVGCHIINSSLGYTQFDEPSQNHSFASLDGKTSFASRAATVAARKGLLVCNSAGNGGGGSWYKIGIPADADSIVTVGAIDSDGVLASFSSIGPTADGRIKPDLVALGSSATIVNSYSGNIAQSSGTSFSSPILAGMFASLWSAFPEKSNWQIIDAVKKSADNYLNPNNQYGYGIPDFCSAFAILKGYDFSADQFYLTSANPATSELKAEFIAKNQQQITISLYTTQGKLLYQNSKALKENNTLAIQIPIEVLANGIYFLNAQSETFSKTIKIVKQ